MYAPYAPDPRLKSMYGSYGPPLGGFQPRTGGSFRVSAPVLTAPPATQVPKFNNFLDEYTTPGSTLDEHGRPRTGVDPTTKQQFLNGNLFRNESLWQGAPGDDPTRPSMGLANILQAYGPHISQFSYLPPGFEQFADPNAAAAAVSQQKGGINGPPPVDTQGPPPGTGPSMPAGTPNPLARGPGPNISPNRQIGPFAPGAGNFPYNPTGPAPAGTWGDVYGSLFGGDLNPNEQRTFNRQGVDPRLDSALNYAMQEALARYQDPNGMTFYGGPTVANFTDPEKQAQQMLLQQAGGMQTGGGLDFVNTMLQRATDPASDPTLQSAIDAMSKDAVQQFTDPGGVLSQIRSTSLSNGAYGGTRQGVMEGVLGGRLADAIAKNSANMRLDARGQSLQAASSALGQLNPAIQAATAPATIVGGVGTQQRNMNQSFMDDALKRWAYNTFQPDVRLQNLYGSLGATNLGGYTGGQGFLGSDLIQRVGSPTTAQNVAGGLAGALALWNLFKGQNGATA